MILRNHRPRLFHAGSLHTALRDALPTMERDEEYYMSYVMVVLSNSSECRSRLNEHHHEQRALTSRGRGSRAFS